jgi:sensor domain CHASE-containing protein
MTTLVGVAVARAAAANGVTPGAVIANPGARGAWLMFAGIVIAWIVTVLGSFRGRAQSVVRAHRIGIAA